VAEPPMARLVHLPVGAFADLFNHVIPTRERLHIGKYMESSSLSLSQLSTQIQPKPQEREPLADRPPLAAHDPNICRRHSQR
jgi:hypothetical protein